jgi:ubiquinol oxidase
MIPLDIDLKNEQEATFNRKLRQYGVLARILFRAMDRFYGEELTLGKMRLLEILARIPYQAWEARQYKRMTHRFSDSDAVIVAEDVISWSRSAQDSEFWHLRVINEKMKEENVSLHWFKDRIMPYIAAFQYSLFSRVLVLVSPRTAYVLNADFEDHAEYEYMNYVLQHPELDSQTVVSDVISGYRRDLKTWGDVMRFIGLEERDHMNNSLRRCGRESETVPIPSN